MDHGNPTIEGATVWFCSDEHITFASPDEPPAVGDRIRVIPAHVDPTMSQHESRYVVDGDGPDALVLERLEVDLRGW